MAEPTLRWGSSGAAVERLQTALQTRGYYRGSIDGRFGAQTHNAVVAYQAARRLPMDGIVGARTWAELGAATAPNGDAPAPTGGARGVSIHIGVNHINPAHYGTNGLLTGCENDARAMEAIARARGYTSELILSAQATTTAVLAAIGRAAAALRSGDILLLTYAGHGAQAPDLTGDDQDGQDETWCLFDRMLLDDELAAALGQFQPGVRVVVLSDSCHSGTVTRDGSAIVKEAYYGPLAAEVLTRELGGVPGGGEPTLTRNLPQANVQDTLSKHYATYAAARNAVSRVTVSATVLLISGCQDNQLSQESGGRGKFSVMLEQVYANGAFTGDYRALHRAIGDRMPPTQTPNLTVTGAPNAQFEAETPFTIAAARAVAAPRGLLIPLAA